MLEHSLDIYRILDVLNFFCGIMDALNFFCGSQFLF